MKKFTMLLLSVIFVTLIAGSVQSVAADHLEQADQGIFKDENRVNVVTTKDSKYQVYLHVEVRNAQGKLISISESTVFGGYIPHKITDDTFNEKLGKKEIITIDNVKYEKAQYTGKLDMKQLMPISQTSHFIGSWVISLCALFDKHGYGCISVFEANTSYVSIAEDDIVTNYWTILREIN